MEVSRYLFIPALRIVIQETDAGRSMTLDLKRRAELYRTKVVSVVLIQVLWASRDGDWVGWATMQMRDKSLLNCIGCF